MKKVLVRSVQLVGVLTIAGILYQNATVPSYTYAPAPLPATFDEFYRAKLAESARLKARPDNEEKLVRYAPGKTPVAILYIHGYGASRKEGELVVSRVAADLKANVYYLRLPGHGTNKEDHLAADYRKLLDESITALRMMQQLGDRVVVVGTSMGGLIATYMAAQYPEMVSGVVLASPFYRFAPAYARIMYFKPLFKLYCLAAPTRTVTDVVLPDRGDWRQYWYTEQYSAAVQMAIDLSRLVDRDAVLGRVSAPVLLLYHYENEKNQDQTASVPAMRLAFSAFGRAAAPNPLNRQVAIAKSEHCVLSDFVRKDMDTETPRREIVEFVKKLPAR